MSYVFVCELCFLSANLNVTDCTELEGEQLFLGKGSEVSPV